MGHHTIQMVEIAVPHEKKLTRPPFLSNVQLNLILIVVKKKIRKSDVLINEDDKEHLR